MQESEDARRVAIGSGPIELTMLFYDGKTCRYFPHEENNATYMPPDWYTVLWLTVDMKEPWRYTPRGWGRWTLRRRVRT
jgi:hypothetical protein